MNISAMKLNNWQLRFHQTEAKEQIFNAWNEVNSVMLQMPTGTGKTYLFCSIIKDIINNYKAGRKEVNILIVVHRMELIEQISETLAKFNIPHGFIQGTREQHLWRRVQVASIMSLLTDKNYLNTLRQNYDFIIVDEAHHSLAESYVNLFALFPNAKKLGVTATPWRFNHESFLKLYHTLITSRPISWFIKQGILSDFDYVSIKADSKLQALVNSIETAHTGDFVNHALDFAFNNMRIRSKLFKSYLKFAKGRKGIIYAINRAHAAKIAELYSKNGVKAVAIDCDTPKEVRKNLIDQFKKGQIKVLVNVDIFTEGFDCPDVNFIQLARPTRSLALYLQQVGRGLRMSEGKEKTIILDNVGLYNYFGLPDANRKWQYHFKGIEEYEPIGKDGGTRIDFVNEPMPKIEDEAKFDEEDEDMLVVHETSMWNGSTNLEKIQSTLFTSERVKLPIEEFQIAEYYLVRGNELSFKVYPLVKKRGKCTEGVAAPVFEFDYSKTPFELSSVTQHNKEVINADIKLHTLLSFTAMLLHIETDIIYNPLPLISKNKGTTYNKTSLFTLLKTLSQVSPP